jgi:hypothetical protein
MEGRKLEDQIGILVVSAILLGAFIICELLSYTVLKNTVPTKYLLRMVARGSAGVLAIYHGLLMYFKKKKYYLTSNTTPSQNRFAGAALAILGAALLLTAFLGYGTNGDPRYLWWQ